MKVIESNKFKTHLKEITNYIKKDKKEVAIKFAKELKIKILSLREFPYRCRKSIYFDDENIRDLIFKGYTITYEIKENSIIILDIFNQNKR